jgi:hypothetical protein
LDTSVHAINLNYKKNSPLKEWYYDMMFKITKGRAVSLVQLLPWPWRNFYYDHIKTIFKPHHERLRKAIPRQWSDLTHLIVVVNLEFIKSFYEDEFSKGIVDWNANPKDKAFAQWLKKTYKYVTVERPKLLKDIENAYPEDNVHVFEKSKDEEGKVRWEWKGKENPKTTYKRMYGKVDLLEKRLEEKDTKVITEMVKHRGYFWT